METKSSKLDFSSTLHVSRSLKTQITQTHSNSNTMSLLTVSYSHSSNLVFPLTLTFQIRSSRSLSVSLSLFTDSSLHCSVSTSLHRSVSASASLRRSASLYRFLPQTLILGGSTGRDSVSITSKDSLSLSSLLLLFLYDIGFLILLVIILEKFFIPNMLKYRIWVFQIDVEGFGFMIISRSL